MVYAVPYVEAKSVAGCMLLMMMMMVVVVVEVEVMVVEVVVLKMLFSPLGGKLL